MTIARGGRAGSMTPAQSTTIDRALPVSVAGGGADGRRFGPGRPAQLENGKGLFEREHQRDEAELAELDPDVERYQRRRDVAGRQPGLGESSGKTEAVEEAEGEGDDPGIADGEAG